MDNSKVVIESPRRKLVASGRINRYGRFMRDLFDREYVPMDGLRRVVECAALPVQRAECGE